jgi:crotonobetainyl-CoA:carnitine CoA-transferase CaiB-like acyl-CoA transferase
VGSIVDVSLLGTALWVNSSDVVYSAHLDTDASATTRVDPHHRTADDRWVMLDIPDPHRWFAEVCRLIDREDLLDDERFATRDALLENRAAFRAEVDHAIATAPLEEWTERLHRTALPGEPVQTPWQVLDDPQVTANGYVGEAEHPGGEAMALVRAPVQFDEDVHVLRTAPAAGADTDAVLHDVGYAASDIARLRAEGVLG